MKVKAKRNTNGEREFTIKATEREMTLLWHRLNLNDEVFAKHYEWSANWAGVGDVEDDERFTYMVWDDIDEALTGGAA